MKLDGYIIDVDEMSGSTPYGDAYTVFPSKFSSQLEGQPPVADFDESFSRIAAGCLMCS